MSKFLRLNDIKSITGLSRSTIYLMVKNGDFPSSVKIGARAVGWLESDLHAWIESRISLKSTRHAGGCYGAKS